MIISQDEQLQLMEDLACMGGHDNWDAVRAEMHDALKLEYPGVDWELEPISAVRKSQFIDWLEESDD